MLIELVLDGARWIVGDDRHCALCGDGFAQMIRIVGRIGHDNFGGKILDQAARLGRVAFLAGCQHKTDRTSEAADGHVYLGAQAAARAADGLIFSPPFFAPAACW